MLRDYQIVSPSLEGVLRYELPEYEGARRPVELLRVLDGPSAKGSTAGRGILTAEERQLLQGYFQDVYGIFLKRLSNFAVANDLKPDEGVKLQAMLQELLKIRGLIGAGER